MNAVIKECGVLVPPGRMHSFVASRHPGIQCGDETSLALAGAVDMFAKQFILEIGLQAASKHRVAIRAEEVGAALLERYSMVASLTVPRDVGAILVSEAPARALDYGVLESPFLQSKVGIKKLNAKISEFEANREKLIDKDDVEDEELQSMLLVGPVDEWLASFSPNSGEPEESPEEPASSSSSDEESVAERVRKRKRKSDGDGDDKDSRKRRKK